MSSTSFAFAATRRAASRVVGDHREHRLAEVAQFAVAEDRVVVDDRAAFVRPRNVVGTSAPRRRRASRATHRAASTSAARAPPATGRARSAACRRSRRCRRCTSRGRRRAGAPIREAGGCRRRRVTTRRPARVRPAVHRRACSCGCLHRPVTSAVRASGARGNVVSLPPMRERAAVKAVPSPRTRWSARHRADRAAASRARSVRAGCAQSSCGTRRSRACR